MRFLLLTGCFFVLLVSASAHAQFSPKEFEDLKSKLGGDQSQTAQSLPTANFSSAEEICANAQTAQKTNAAMLVSKTDMAGLKASLMQLIPDKKDQFETLLEFENRQTSRRAQWVREHPFLVLPTAVASGTNVYDADSQIYTLGNSGGGLELRPTGWASPYGSGFVGINLASDFPFFRVEMTPLNAKQFFETSAENEVVYVAKPLTPYVERTVSYLDNFRLRASVVCRFVRTKADFKIKFFTRP